MTSARRSTPAPGTDPRPSGHPRIRTARGPVTAGLAATACLIGAWYATARASTTAASALAPTSTTVSPRPPRRRASAPVTPSYTAPPTGASTSTTLRIARLTP